MAGSPAPSPILTGLAGTVAGFLLKVGHDYLKRARSRPSVVVRRFSNRRQGRFDRRKLPTITSDRANARFVVLTARNTSPWTEAKECVPHVYILPTGTADAIRADGIWYPMSHTRDPTGIAENSRSIGPRGVEPFVCLALANGHVYYYDAMESGDEAEDLWKRVEIGASGSFGLLTYIHSDNARKLVGRDFNVIVEDGGVPGVDVKFTLLKRRGIDFRQMMDVHEYLSTRA